jgi:hypothetical protein
MTGIQFTIFNLLSDTNRQKEFSSQQRTDSLKVDVSEFILVLLFKKSEKLRNVFCLGVRFSFIRTL